MTLSAATVTAVRNASATTAVATGTIAAKTLLALFCQADSDDGNAAESLSISATGGFTWTKNVQANGSPGAVAAIFTAPVAAGSTTQTVSIADSRGSKDKSVFLVKFTDDNGNIPGVGNTATATSDLTTSATGSWGWMAIIGTAGDNDPVTGLTIQDASADAGFNDGDTIATFSFDAKSTGSGQTMDFTHDGLHNAKIEILAGTSGGSSDATVTPSVVAATATVGAVSLRTDEIATPSTVAGVAAVGAVSAHGGANSSVSTVTGTTAVGTVTVKTGSTAAPATVAGTTAIGTVTVKASSTAAPSTVAGTAAVGSPTVKTGSTVTAGNVAAAASIPAPSVSAGGNATASPSTVAAAVAIGAVSGHAGQTVTVSTVAGVASIGAAGAKTGSTAAPATVAAKVSIAVPTVTSTVGGAHAGRLASSTSVAVAGSSSRTVSARSATSAGHLSSTT